MNKKNRLDIPLDMGITWRGKRLFGQNKTIKGPICMGIFTMIFGFLTFLFLKNNIDLNFSNLQVSVFFFLIGIAYSLGELPNSFIKRQLDIVPGKTHPNTIISYIFKLFDTFDSLVLVGASYVLLFHFQIENVIIAILIGGIIHLVTDKLMVLMVLK